MPASIHPALTADETECLVAVLESLPHNAKLGIRVADVGRGHCTAYIEYRPELVGDPSRGVLHGGAVTTLIDATSGAAVYASLPGGTPLATLDMRIDYLKPAEPHKRLHAHAELYGSRAGSRSPAPPPTRTIPATRSRTAPLRS